MQIYKNAVKKYLTDMHAKNPVPFARIFPNTDPQALQLLQKLLAFDPYQRPTAEEVSNVAVGCLSVATG